MTTLKFDESTNMYMINNQQVKDLKMISFNENGAYFDKNGLELDISDLNICEVPTIHEEYNSKGNVRSFNLSEFGGDEIGHITVISDLDSDNMLTVEIYIQLSEDWEG